MPEEHFDADRGSLLRFVAERTAEVVRRHAGGEPRPVIGFCFSFPLEQTALDNGTLLSWTKVPGRSPARTGRRAPTTLAGAGLQALAPRQLSLPAVTASCHYPLSLPAHSLAYTRPSTPAELPGQAPGGL